MPIMGRMFKKTKSEARQATSKSDMLKKFGGKFKKAFSKNKQVLLLANILPGLSCAMPMCTSVSKD